MGRREIVALGTSCQVPTRERNHVATLVRLGEVSVLVDCGEGTQRQMLRASAASSRVSALCLTHEHGDHTYGVPGFLNRRRLDGAVGPLPIVAPEAALERLDLLTRFATRGDVPLHRWVPAPSDGLVEVMRLNEWGVWTAPLKHGVPTVGYRFVEDDGRRVVPEQARERGVWGPEIGRLQRGEQIRGVSLDDVSVPRPGQRIAVIMDTAVCDGALALAQGCDLLVVEATYVEAEAALAEENLHLTARQAATLAVEAGVRRLVLTHFSSRYGDLDEHAKEAGAIHPDVVVAHDLQTVAVPSRRLQ
ncbi:ribonuclease Z [Kineosporia rhizophila]|uniref:ribonuclease Z n=1 Tax=Kineosporia TaxID=49184 RepID=UPI001E2C9D9F|nr:MULTISPECIES: ribonuclease Z [Kineosporia]MCE0534594.1 ribonuclease Z [Kineosporia rhizophila]GLY15617.1 ribonuclease Z [Kineosporia sp. NBRC 101677]